jgi:hypothetical protein
MKNIWSQRENLAANISETKSYTSAPDISHMAIVKTLGTLQVSSA